MNKSGIIIKGVAGTYTIRCDDGLYKCRARGVFRNKNITPLVGDTCKILISDSKKKLGTIDAIAARSNELKRPPVANIDQAIITIASKEPEFHPGLLDRFLIMAAHEHIPAIICVNKTDLAISDAFKIYQDAGYVVLFTSTYAGHGLDELKMHMRGKINVLAGPSGVGKSSLLNALAAHLDLETGDLSQKLARGKHTTRHTEIFMLTDDPADGYCVDTPGFTSLDIFSFNKSDIQMGFQEFNEFRQTCRFKNCMHHKEIDCGVKEQVGKTIHPSRYESYIKLLEADPYETKY